MLAVYTKEELDTVVHFFCCSENEKMDQSGGGDNEENKIYPELPQTDEVKSILNQLNQLKTRRSDLLAELDDIDVKIDQLQGIWLNFVDFTM